MMEGVGGGGEWGGYCQINNTRKVFWTEGNVNPWKERVQNHKI